MKKRTAVMLAALTLLPALAWADDPIAADTVQTHADYVWTLVCAFLVFFMQGSPWWKAASPGRSRRSTS